MFDHVFVLTGAGISAESGLGTFRDKDGLWTQYDLADVASIEGYRRNRSLVLSFYDARRRNLEGAAPNAAHGALARLQAALAKAGRLMTLVTQNVDDLHEQAGSKDVIHMHGELRKVRCEACRTVTEWRGDLAPHAACAWCGANTSLRPDIVWFGEMPLHMNRIEEALVQADLFVSIGTSGSVYPAAGYVTIAREMGIATMELNLEPSENAWAFDSAHYGPASVVVPAWADACMAQLGAP